MSRARDLEEELLLIFQHLFLVVEPAGKVHEPVNIHQLLACEPFIILIGLSQHLGHCGSILFGLNLGYCHGSPINDTGGFWGVLRCTFHFKS